MRKILLVPLVAALVAGSAGTAAANSINFELQLVPIGIWTGRSIEGAKILGTQADFFHRNEGGLMGARGGFAVGPFEVFADFAQPFGTEKWKDAWIAVMGGLKGEFKLVPGSGTFAFAALDGGYGWGASGDITDVVTGIRRSMSQSGALVVLRLGLEYYLGPYVAIGMEYDTGYHYMTVDSELTVARDDRIHGMHFTGLMFVKLLVGTGQKQMKRHEQKGFYEREEEY